MYRVENSLLPWFGLPRSLPSRQMVSAGFRHYLRTYRGLTVNTPVHTVRPTSLEGVAMAFIIKDLMISVLGEREAPDLFDASDHCSGPCCLNPCWLPSCDNNSCVVTPPTGGFGQNVINPPDLAFLKEQLTMALADVERREAAVKQALAPKTLAQAEAAESRLREALEEVQAMKERFQRG